MDRGFKIIIRYRLEYDRMRHPIMAGETII